MRRYAISWMSYDDNQVEIYFTSGQEGWEATLRKWLDDMSMFWVAEEVDRCPADTPATIEDYKTAAFNGNYALGFEEIPDEQ